MKKLPPPPPLSLHEIVLFNHLLQNSQSSSRGEKKREVNIKKILSTVINFDKLMK
jgi:hypothetical protein